MQNHGNIQRLIALIILNIIVLVLVVVLYNFTYAQEYPELHQKTLYYLNEKHTSKDYASITVGEIPSAIGVDGRIVYVVHYGEDTVSVIDGKNDRLGKEIPVGKYPSAIGICCTPTIKSNIDRIYVANSGDDTVSVIDGKNNIKIGKDIRVGSDPSAIGVDGYTNTIYVANTADGTVSVINATNNTKIGKDIR